MFGVRLLRIHKANKTDVPRSMIDELDLEPHPDERSRCHIPCDNIRSVQFLAEEPADDRILYRWGIQERMKAFVILCDENDRQPFGTAPSRHSASLFVIVAFMS